MAKRDYYEVLGVSRSATDEEIKKAFRKASLEHHPDRQVGKSEEEKKANEAQFKEIAEAYSILGNKEKRKEYDQYGFTGPNFRNGGPDFSSFRTSDFFQGKGPWADFLRTHGFDTGPDGGGFSFDFGNGAGSGHRNVKKSPEEVFKRDGRDIGVKIGVSIKEQIFGGKKEFDIKLPLRCSKCHGMLGDGFETCSMCHGSGMVTQVTAMMQSTYTCPLCRGVGYTIKNPCSACGGSGRTMTKKHLTVDLKPGLMAGDLIETREGFGEAGVYGGNDGSLIMNCIIEPDGTFRPKRGTITDIEEDIFISPLIGIVGGTIKIPTPDGINSIEVVPGLAEGDILTITNAGLKYKIESASDTALSSAFSNKIEEKRGKLFVNVHFGTLTNLSNEEIKTLRNLSDKISPESVKEFARQMKKYRLEYS